MVNCHKEEKVTAGIACALKLICSSLINNNLKF